MVPYPPRDAYPCLKLKLNLFCLFFTSSNGYDFEEIAEMDSPGRAMNASAFFAISDFLSCMSSTVLTSPMVSPNSYKKFLDIYLLWLSLFRTNKKKGKWFGARTSFGKMVGGMTLGIDKLSVG